jgi:hypothetical protein
MSLEIIIECLGCGLFFKQDFRDMSHGRVLKCPFCYSTALGMQGEVASEDYIDPQATEATPKDRFINYKVKF